MEAHDRSPRSSRPRRSSSRASSSTSSLACIPRSRPSIFIPVIVAMEWMAVADDLAIWKLALLTLGGVVIWTLTEYWLHRLVFHWEPDNAFGRRMHFIIHGIHHDHPNDKLRLVMPPAVSIPLAALFFLAFTLVFGDARGLSRSSAGSSPATWSMTTRTTTCTTSCRSPNSARSCASSTCATTSRITVSDSASPRRSGTRSSRPCRGSAAASPRPAPGSDSARAPRS